MPNDEPIAERAESLESRGQPDDPVRRDREGWQAGINAAVTRLQDEIESWELEAKNNDITPQDTSFIQKRIAQVKTHIAQIRELKYGDGEPTETRQSKPLVLPPLS